MSRIVPQALHHPASAVPAYRSNQLPPSQEGEGVERQAVPQNFSDQKH
jgi:hypothetical protein